MKKFLTGMVLCAMVGSSAVMAFGAEKDVTKIESKDGEVLQFVLGDDAEQAIAEGKPILITMAEEGADGTIQMSTKEISEEALAEAMTSDMSTVDFGTEDVQIVMDDDVKQAIAEGKPILMTMAEEGADGTIQMSTKEISEEALAEAMTSDVSMVDFDKEGVQIVLEKAALQAESDFIITYVDAEGKEKTVSLQEAGEL